MTLQRQHLEIWKPSKHQRPERGSGSLAPRTLWKRKVALENWNGKTSVRESLEWPDHFSWRWDLILKDKLMRTRCKFVPTILSLLQILDVWCQHDTPELQAVGQSSREGAWGAYKSSHQWVGSGGLWSPDRPAEMTDQHLDWPAPTTMWVPGSPGGAKTILHSLERAESRVHLSNEVHCISHVPVITCLQEYSQRQHSRVWGTLVPHQALSSKNGHGYCERPSEAAARGVDLNIWGACPIPLKGTSRSEGTLWYPCTWSF